MADTPQVPARRGAETLPAERRLTSIEMEAVIRRAVELQAHEQERGPAEGISEGELVRIGSELGLSQAHMQRALAEVRGRGVAERDPLFGRGFGAGRVVASRVMGRSAAAVRSELDAYLRDRECMVPQRRLADRIVYAQASGAVSAIKRAASRVSSRYPLLQVKTLEVSVQPVDEGSCFVAVAVDMTGQRAGMAVGGLLGGGGAAATVGVSLAVAIAPPLALVGVPVFLGGLVGMRSIYRYMAEQMREKLESFLDRVEHRELPSQPMISRGPGR